MSDQRTKARLAVSLLDDLIAESEGLRRLYFLEFQSALRTKFEAERDFTRAHDQAKDTTDSDIEEMVNLRRKLGMVTP